MRRAPLLVVILLVVSALVTAACGDDDGEAVRTIGGSDASGSGNASGVASGSASGSGVAACRPVGDLSTADREVDVVLDEWAIGAPTEIEAGTVGFVAKNTGDEPHELVVVKGVAVADLPRDDDGALVEDDLPEGALLGEIEAFPPGETCSGVFDLAPGAYSLVCNIVETEEGGEVEAHLAKGMALDVTVG